MNSSTISPDTLEFLRDLQENNYREWFYEHKGRYESAHANMIAFADGLIDRMSDEDKLVPMTGKKSLFRIYRDVRFSKDKSPYKKSMSGRLKRATQWLRGGYYYHIEPGNSFIAGGFWAPNKEDLKMIREELATDAQPLRNILADSTFKQMFGSLRGEGVKTAPKGFDKTHPDIDLIRMKQFIVHRDFRDEQVLAESFLEEVVETYLAMQPFFNYMGDILTAHLSDDDK